ncbi:hypothetical protein [Pannonibacter indicus]|uniref:hypothetical protein n=1 Tax=Pannonibacter indicus TaxID=466044 RepID=UPI00391B8533
MKNLAVSVLVNLRDRLSGGLGGISRRLAALGSLSRRLGLDRVGKALANVGRQAMRMATMITAAFSLAVGGAWKMARDIAAAGDAAFKAAQRTGTNVEKFQELSYAADLSDLSTESLERALGRLSEMASTGDKAFTQLGVTIKGSDGKLRDSSEYLKDFADVFAALPDGARKTALANKLFGDRLGRELIPFLNEGRAGLEKLGQEARDLSVVIPEDTAKSSVDWNDNISRLSAAFTGLKNEVIGPLIPLFNELTNQVRAFIAENKADIVEALSGAIRSIVEVVPDFAGHVMTAGRAIAQMVRFAGSLTEALGGLEVVAAPLAAVIGGKLVLAIAALGHAMAMTPIGRFMAVIAAIAGAAAYIYKNWDGIVAYFSGLWDRVMAACSAAWEWIKSTLAATWETIKTVLSYHPLALIISNWDEIVAFFTGLGKRMADALRSGVSELLAIGGELMQALWDGISAKIDEMMAWLANVPGRITGVFDGLGGKLGSFFGFGGDEPAPAPAPGAAGQLGRIAGAGAAASAAAYQAPAGAVAAQQQEAKVGGKVVLEVIGPAQVRSVNSTNSDAPIVMDRGQSLGAP